MFTDDFSIISSQTDLATFCHQASQQSVLILDTEFVRTRTLKPLLGLIQAYDGISAVLIDPLADIDLTIFWSLLANTAITKVLHSGSEDLEVFKYYANCLPEPLFDSQVAAAMLGDGTSLGYAALAQKYLDVYIDKGESRTDWLARPLSDKQLVYAANDVIYLKPIFEQLKQRLLDKGFYDYVIDEGRLAVAKRHIDRPKDEIYRQIKGAWRLEPVELAILQRIAAWRQHEAERRDLAVNFVVKEANMITIATRQPSNLDELRNLSGILPQEVRYHGNILLDFVRQGQQVAPQDLPPKVDQLINYPNYKGIYRQMRLLIDDCASQQGLPTEVIASKRQIHQLLSWAWKLNDEQRQVILKPDLLQGWRLDMIGHQLIAALDATAV